MGPSWPDCSARLCGVFDSAQAPAPGRRPGLGGPQALGLGDAWTAEFCAHGAGTPLIWVNGSIYIRNRKLGRAVQRRGAGGMQAAMVRERSEWGYYVRAIRDLTDPPSWRWRIIRRGNPMGVLLEGRLQHL